MNKVVKHIMVLAISAFLLLVGGGVFYYYVIFLPNLEEIKNQQAQTLAENTRQQAKALAESTKRQQDHDEAIRELKKINSVNPNLSRPPIQLNAAS